MLPADGMVFGHNNINKDCCPMMLMLPGDVFKLLSNDANGDVFRLLSNDANVTR